MNVEKNKERNWSRSVQRFKLSLGFLKPDRRSKEW